MTEPLLKEETPKEGRGFFETVFEVIGWIQIVASPLLLTGMIALVYYLSKPNSTRLILGICFTTVGLIVGIIWATKVWKKRGTMDFMSRISATPELDDLDCIKKRPIT